MAIEITTGGVTKTYRYYPYDAFYVNGTQVKETWFNGVKYYPEDNRGVWGIKLSSKLIPRISYKCRNTGQTSEIQSLGTFRITYVLVATFDSSKFRLQYYASGDMSAVENKNSYSDTSNLPPVVLSSVRMLGKLCVEFDSTVTNNDPPYWYAFNQKYFTGDTNNMCSQLESGITFNLPFTNDVENGNTINITDCISVYFGSGVTYPWRRSLDYPTVKIKFDYDQNKIPPRKNFWDYENGSPIPYPLLVNAGLAGQMSYPIDCNNSFISISRGWDEKTSQFKAFVPTNMDISESDLLPFLS